jgi:hypothetical protein
MKYHSKESDYGFNGLINIFNQKEIDMNDWVFKQLDKERGGIKFMLPNAEGEIYLKWDDLYYIDITFVTTKQKYNEAVSLGDLKDMITLLEDQRKRTVVNIREMLMDKFGSNKERTDGKPF